VQEVPYINGEVILAGESNYYIAYGNDGQEKIIYNPDDYSYVAESYYINYINYDFQLNYNRNHNVIFNIIDGPYGKKPINVRPAVKPNNDLVEADGIKEGNAKIPIIILEFGVDVF
jgi:hypothetical protein